MIAKKTNFFGGRPRLSEDKKRNRIIKISLTEAEYLFIQKYANEAGYKQIARFLRTLMFALIELGSFKFIERNVDDVEYFKMLRNGLNNLNQSTHRLNEAAKYGSIEIKLAKAHAQIAHNLKKQLSLSHNLLMAGHEKSIHLESSDTGDQ